MIMGFGEKERSMERVDGGVGSWGFKAQAVSR